MASSSQPSASSQPPPLHQVAAKQAAAGASAQLQAASSLSDMRNGDSAQEANAVAMLMKADCSEDGDQVQASSNPPMLVQSLSRMPNGSFVDYPSAMGVNSTPGGIAMASASALDSSAAAYFSAIGGGTQSGMVLSPSSVASSVGLMTSPTDGDTTPSNKRQVRLLKNREAAKECRRKKKEYVRCLENRVAVLEAQNTKLMEELKTLKDMYCHKVEETGGGGPGGAMATGLPPGASGQVPDGVSVTVQTVLNAMQPAGGQ